MTQRVLIKLFARVAGIIAFRFNILAAGAGYLGQEKIRQFRLDAAQPSADFAGQIFGEPRLTIPWWGQGILISAELLLAFIAFLGAWGFLLIIAHRFGPKNRY